MRSKKLVAMMLVRNEAARYLREVLDDLDQFVDEMLIVDDASTDETPDVCASYARARVVRRHEPSFSNEVALRKLSWEEAVATGAEWILAVDADEVFEDRMKREIDQLLGNDNVDGWAFRLYDFWGSREYYRDDRYWQAHRYHRLFLVRNPHVRPRWKETPLHCGRLPLNAVDPARVGRSSIRVKHLGWADPAEHRRKYEHYMRLDGQGTYGILPQYASILDARPRLKRWEETETPASRRVLVGAAVRQKPDILRLFLESLGRLEHSTVDLDFTFVDDNVDAESSALLERFRAEISGVDIQAPAGGRGPAARHLQDETGHRWNGVLIDRVAQHKEQMLARARQERYDFLFLIDSDVLVSPETVEHLVRQDKDVVAEVYWTRWRPEHQPLPQVWLRDQYDLQLRAAGGGRTTAEDVERGTRAFLEMLRRPGVYPVGGLGACTLISLQALARGVSFRTIPNVSFVGEDRHFCIRAAAMGLELFVDTHLPAFHVYRETDIPDGRAFLDRWPRRRIWEALASLPRDADEPAIAPELVRAVAEHDGRQIERLAILRIKAGAAEAAHLRVLGEALARQEFWLTARRVMERAARLDPTAPWAKPLKAICSMFPDVGERPYVEKILSSLPDRPSTSAPR
jgi:hypothetical protein